jgi:hypothetical protein
MRQPHSCDTKLFWRIPGLQVAHLFLRSSLKENYRDGDIVLKRRIGYNGYTQTVSPFTIYHFHNRQHVCRH